MEYLKKIGKYLYDNGYVFICWGVFLVTVTTLCSFVFLWIISLENPNIANRKYDKYPTCDTTYVIVKPELDEIRIALYSENKDSVWILPLNTRGVSKKANKK